MFDQIGDLPIHPLAVHAPIVMIPMAAVLSIVYAVALPWRRYTGWAVAFLAAGSAIGGGVAKSSGESFADSQGIANTDPVQEHSNYGTVVFYLALVLGVLAVALVAVDIFRGRMNELESLRHAFAKSPGRASDKKSDKKEEDATKADVDSSEPQAEVQYRRRLIWACVSTGLSVAAVLVGVAATVYVVLAGHSGADMVWGPN
ncbi:MAG: hypothetical protein HOQ05_02790 [Corynebacteriales bacterium]|nr:hypothetical protein [Mycobacteriales bacterium]